LYNITPNLPALPIRKFFAEAIGDDAELTKLQNAWSKAVFLHVTLWSRSYTAEGLW